VCESRLGGVHQLVASPVTRGQAASDFGPSFDLLNGYPEMASKVSDNPIQLDVVDHVHGGSRISRRDVDAIVLLLDNDIAEQD